ncbi:MAG: hypothetical protein KAU94_11475 [Verrucomicrobia bacterium]|nr:hypothetical protein [Verrucomicrobiota bacterium]
MTKKTALAPVFWGEQKISRLPFSNRLKLVAGLGLLRLLIGGLARYYTRSGRLQNLRVLRGSYRLIVIGYHRKTLQGFVLNLITNN